MRPNGITLYCPREMRAIEKAIEFVNENAEKQITADGLAEEYEITVKKLQRGFVKQTGKTVHSFLLSVRLQKAKSILSDLDMEIKAIPQKIGFCTVSHFGYCFKRFTGLTPMEFRCQNISIE